MIGEVAVGDDRDRHRVLDGADRRPVGCPGVELAARAAVDGDHPDAGGLGAARQLGRVDRGVVPAEPHLQRHRQRRGADRRLDQGQRMVEVAHQRRAGVAARHLLGRAAHVDVDDVGAGVGRGPGALGHPVRLAAGELDDMGAVAGALGPEQRLGVADRQLVSGHHFRDDQPGADRRAPASRNGRSETPDIGARSTRFGIVAGPIASGSARRRIASMFCIFLRQAVDCSHLSQSAENCKRECVALQRMCYKTMRFELQKRLQGDRRCRRPLP